MNENNIKSGYSFEIGANLAKLNGYYLRIGLDNLNNKSEIISRLKEPVTPNSLNLLISSKLTIMLQTKIGEALELVWFRPDLNDIWSYSLKSGFNSVSFQKYADLGLAVFGSSEQHSYLLKILVEPSFQDLNTVEIKEAWIALSQFMIKNNLPYKAFETAA
jgi:hypothetical protein